MKLVRKDIPFKWTNECEKAFNLLKKRFTIAPILVYFDPLKESIVESNSSN